MREFNKHVLNPVMMQLAGHSTGMRRLSGIPGAVPGRVMPPLLWRIG